MQKYSTSLESALIKFSMQVVKNRSIEYLSAMVTGPGSGPSVRDGLISSEPTLAAPIKEQDASYENANAAAVVLEKLACLDVTRKAERERRREESRAAADPRESVARFLTNFATRQHNVEDALRHMLANYQSQQQHQPHEQPSSPPGARQQPQANPDAPKPEPLAVSSSNPDTIQASLELVSAEALSLEQAAASASYYLPAYDQKQCAAAVAALRASIECTRAALVPRRRFAFGSKKVSKVRGEEVSAAAAAAPPPSACTEAITAAAIPYIASGPSTTFGLDGFNRVPHPHLSAPGVAALQMAESSGGVRSLGMVVGEETSRSDDRMDTADQVVSMKTVSDQDRALVARGRGLLGRTDATVVMTAEEISESGTGGDFVLLDLTRCFVVLLGRLRALRMSGLRDCTVVSGPVTGACFVDDVRGSSLSLATYQVGCGVPTRSCIAEVLLLCPCVTFTALLNTAWKSPFRTEHLPCCGC